jgi:hypothetical protein
MQGGFERVQQPSSKYCIIQIVHVNNVKGYVLGSWVLWGVERDRQSNDTDWFNSFATEAVERLR